MTKPQGNKEAEKEKVNQSEQARTCYSNKQPPNQKLQTAKVYICFFYVPVKDYLENSVHFSYSETRADGAATILNVASCLSEEEKSLFSI